MISNIDRFPFESGQLFGLLLGDGSIGKGYAFHNTNPRYTSYFLTLSEKIFKIKNLSFKYYLQKVPEKIKTEDVKKWLNYFSFLNTKNLHVYVNTGDSYSRKGILSAFYFNKKFVDRVKFFIHVKIKDYLNNVIFARGFIDGFFAAEGHADKHKSSVKAIITQNYGTKADMTEKALQTIGLRYYKIRDRKTKIQLRIAHNLSLHKLFSFCTISQDKFNNIKPYLAGKYKIHRKSIAHKILEAISDKEFFLQDLYTKINFNKENIRWYVNHKMSPLNKYSLIEKTTGNCVTITNEGKEALKTLMGTGQKLPCSS